MKNGPINSRSKLKQSNVVYKFTCPYHQDTPHCYIGHTRTLLARRLTMHVQGGSIKEHLKTQHQISINRQLLDDNTEILQRRTVSFKA